MLIKELDIQVIATDTGELLYHLTLNPNRDYQPQQHEESRDSPNNPLAVPVAVVLGIPLYSNAAGILPLVEALHAKGLSIGTVLAFMMSVVALSLPEMILLRRVLKPRLLGVFVAVVGTGILAVGFMFNLVL